MKIVLAVISILLVTGTQEGVQEAEEVMEPDTSWLGPEMQAQREQLRKAYWAQLEQAKPCVKITIERTLGHYRTSTHSVLTIYRDGSCELERSGADEPLPGAFTGTVDREVFLRLAALVLGADLWPGFGESFSNIDCSGGRRGTVSAWAADGGVGTLTDQWCSHPASLDTWAVMHVEESVRWSVSWVPAGG